MWDSNRIGAGATPVKTDKGWLEVYHGVDDDKHYQLGIVYLDLNDPSKSSPAPEPLSLNPNSISRKSDWSQT